MSDGLTGSLDRIEMVEFVDQNPIGKAAGPTPPPMSKRGTMCAACLPHSPRPNRGYKPSVFSFNTSGGRCETCEGEGRVSIGMQFTADVTLTCDACKGRRFTDPVLEIEVDGHTIHDVLSMTVAEASAFFGNRPSPQLPSGASSASWLLLDVGLGYVTLGQSATTLSGGEAQRIKLGLSWPRAIAPATPSSSSTNPPRGSISRRAQLLEAFDALIQQGHTVICVEHNLDVMACADHIVDLGLGAEVTVAAGGHRYARRSGTVCAFGNGTVPQGAVDTLSMTAT